MLCKTEFYNAKGYIQFLLFEIFISLWSSVINHEAGYDDTFLKEIKIDVLTVDD